MPSRRPVANSVIKASNDLSKYLGPWHEWIVGGIIIVLAICAVVATDTMLDRQKTTLTSLKSILTPRQTPVTYTREEVEALTSKKFIVNKSTMSIKGAVASDMFTLNTNQYYTGAGCVGTRSKKRDKNTIIPDYSIFLGNSDYKEADDTSDDANQKTVWIHHAMELHEDEDFESSVLYNCTHPITIKGREYRVGDGRSVLWFRKVGSIRSPDCSWKQQDRGGVINVCSGGGQYHQYYIFFRGTTEESEDNSRQTPTTIIANAKVQLEKYLAILSAAATKKATTPVYGMVIDKETGTRNELCNGSFFSFILCTLTEYVFLLNWIGYMFCGIWNSIWSQVSAIVVLVIIVAWLGYELMCNHRELQSYRAWDRFGQAEAEATRTTSSPPIVDNTKKDVETIDEDDNNNNKETTTKPPASVDHYLKSGNDDHTHEDYDFDLTITSHLHHIYTELMNSSGLHKSNIKMLVMKLHKEPDKCCIHLTLTTKESGPASHRFPTQIKGIPVRIHTHSE